jgi:hypothetical protein
MDCLTDIKGLRIVSPTNEWCVHSYYTLCPYAPDGSGRVLVSAVDLDTERTHILIVSKTGEILADFGEGKAQPYFYHTGSWQSWSKDSKFVFYQGGDMADPRICRYEIATGKVVSIEGDMEGVPPFDEPIIGELLGMLYAAGYANGRYEPEKAPVPFTDRDKHGLFRFSVSENKHELALSVSDVLKIHPDKDKLLEKEKEFIRTTGHKEGFTLMLYCVRWSASGDRVLFYFGNHCVDKSRKEPRICYIFTAKKDLTDIRLAYDNSFGKPGVAVHWSWHPDGEHLVGYAACVPDGKNCVCSVKYDGTEFKKISKHSGTGHPSICPTDYNLLVTDEPGKPGRVVFIDLIKDEEIGWYNLPCMYGDNIPAGRNRYRVCLHPVFSRDGKKIIVNSLPDQNSTVCELDAIQRR